MVVMGRIRIGISEPCLVELFLRGGLGFFQAGDESALGALGVMSKAGFQGSDRLEEEFFLLVENPREVRDLPGVEIADSDVDVLAGAFRSFRSGFAELANHRLKGIHVVPFENRGHHLGACGTASEASEAHLHKRKVEILRCRAKTQVELKFTPEMKKPTRRPVGGESKKWWRWRESNPRADEVQ